MKSLDSASAAYCGVLDPRSAYVSINTSNIQPVSPEAGPELAAAQLNKSRASL